MPTKKDSNSCFNSANKEEKNTVVATAAVSTVPSLKMRSASYSDSKESDSPLSESIKNEVFEIFEDDFLQEISGRIGTRNYIGWGLDELNDTKIGIVFKSPQQSINELNYQHRELNSFEIKAWGEIFYKKDWLVRVKATQKKQKKRNNILVKMYVLLI